MLGRWLGLKDWGGLRKENCVQHMIEVVDFLVDHHLVDDSFVDDEVDDEALEVGSVLFFNCFI